MAYVGGGGFDWSSIMPEPVKIRDYAVERWFSTPAPQTDNPAAAEEMGLLNPATLGYSVPTKGNDEGR